MAHLRPLLITILLALVVIVAWPASAQEPPPSTPGTPAATPEQTPTPDNITPEAPVTADPNACVDGRLRISDLAYADGHLADGLERIQQRARLWQQDAVLVELRLSCPLLMTGLQWEGTFFSATAQANFATDTAAIEPAEEAPEDVPYLDTAGISFQVVYRSLLRAGYADDLHLAAASSITVRLSSDAMPFGPPTAPRGIVYVHVAVEERGVIKDVWINAQDGTIYRYDLEG